MMLRILRIPRYVIPSIYAHLQPKMWYETVIIYIYKKYVSPWRKIAYHPINNEMLKNIFFVAVCETHSVLLKLLMFNFKLFTQRSRMLRLNWMHFLHFCKQKYRIKLLHCAKDIIRTKRLWGKLKYRQQICLAFTISNTHQKLFAITILLVFINRS